MNVHGRLALQVRDANSLNILQIRREPKLPLLPRVSLAGHLALETLFNLL